MQLAIKEKWKSVIFKGDAKNCIDALLNTDVIPDWQSCTTVSNTLSLSSSFVSVKFCWVRRTSNTVAHEAAKFALNSSCDFCFHNGNLPPSLEAACKGDSFVRSV